MSPRGDGAPTLVADAERRRDQIAVAGRNISELNDTDTARMARSKGHKGVPFKGDTSALAETSVRSIDQLFSAFLCIQNLVDEALKASRRLDTSRASEILRGNSVPLADAAGEAASLFEPSGKREFQSLDEALEAMKRQFAQTRAGLARLAEAVTDHGPSVVVLATEARSMRAYLSSSAKALVDGLKAYDGDPVAAAAALGPLRAAVDAARKAKAVAASPASGPEATPDQGIRARIAACRSRIAAIGGSSDLASWLDRLEVSASQGASKAVEIGLGRWEAEAERIEAAPEPDWPGLQGYLDALRAKARTLPQDAQDHMAALKADARSAVAAKTSAPLARSAVKAFEDAVRAATR